MSDNIRAAEGDFPFHCKASDRGMVILFISLYIVSFDYISRNLGACDQELKKKKTRQQ